MPTCSSSLPAIGSDPLTGEWCSLPHKDFRQHQDHFASVGFCSSEWFALVHTPVPMSKAMKIPKAREAVDKEWHKLEVLQKAWDVSKVRERADVIREAKALSLIHI